jgi:endoglucanase
MITRRVSTFLRACLLGGVVLLLAPIAGILGASASPPNFIRVDGRHLADSDGRRFAIKGINLGNWLVPEGYMFKFKHALAPKEIDGVIESLVGPEQATRFWTKFRDAYVGEDDIRFIKAAGFNTVRVPLHWRLFVTPDAHGSNGFEGPGWALLDRLVQWSRNAGLRVIIDLHAAPGGQTGVNHDDGTGFPLTFYIPQYRNLTIALWRALATRYRDDPTVLGYDLLNEPISPYSDEKYLNPQLDPFYREIVAAIRGVDGNHVIFLEGAQWSINFDVFGKPFDANTVYSYHKFWARPERDEVQRYIDFSYRWNVPILIGETGEASDEWNEKFRRLNESFGIDWCFWPYKSLDSDTSVVSIRKPEGWDLIAAAGSGSDRKLDRSRAQTILDAYLEAAKFKNNQVNNGYLESLGLQVPSLKTAE